MDYVSDLGQWRGYELNAVQSGKQGVRFACLLGKIFLHLRLANALANKDGPGV